MLGALLPDIIALGCVLETVGVDAWSILLPFHVPVGTILVAGLLSLIFLRRRRTFTLLSLGIITHYLLDSLLLHAGGGMVLLFPFAWVWGFQTGIIKSDGWILPGFVVGLSLVILICSKLRKA
jgi:hypothetical protein